MSFVELFCGTVHFSRRWYDIKNRMQKYHILPNLTVQSHKLKKNYREMIASTWKINLEIIAYLLINLLELFTSKFEYLGIKVRKIKRLYFDFMSFWIALLQKQKKMESSLEKGLKISHPVFYYAGYLRISPTVACL